MSREIHFVLAVDLDSQTVSVDDGTYVARFQPSEQVWDTDLLAWRDYEEGEYDLALQILNTKPLEND